MKRCFFYEYEEASGLQRGQLWQALTPEEQSRLKQMGYCPKRLLTRGALDYLLEVFPLPDHQTELVSLTVYEKQCGLSQGDIVRLLSPEQLCQLHQLGYRKFCRLPYRAILYLRSLGIY